MSGRTEIFAVLRHGSRRGRIVGIRRRHRRRRIHRRHRQFGGGGKRAVVGGRARHEEQRGGDHGEDGQDAHQHTRRAEEAPALARLRLRGCALGRQHLPGATEMRVELVVDFACRFQLCAVRIRDEVVPGVDRLRRGIRHHVVRMHTFAISREGGVEIERRRGEHPPDRRGGLLVGRRAGVRLRGVVVGLVGRRWCKGMLGDLGLGLGRLHRNGCVGCMLRRADLLLRDLQRIDAVEDADDRLLHRLQHAGVVLVTVAALVDEAFEQPSNLANVARLHLSRLAIGEAGGALLCGCRRHLLEVGAAHGILADEVGEALMRKLAGDGGELRADRLRAGPRRGWRPCRC